LDDGAVKRTLVGVLESTFMIAKLAALCSQLPSERRIPKEFALSLKFILLLQNPVDILLACLDVLLTAFLAQTDRIGANCCWNSLELLLNRILWPALRPLGVLVLNYIVLNHYFLFQPGLN
jgi:hypothetical protein